MNDGQREYLGRVMCYPTIRLPIKVEGRVRSQPLPFQTFTEQSGKELFFLEHFDIRLSASFHTLRFFFHSSVTDVT